MRDTMNLGRCPNHLDRMSSFARRWANVPPSDGTASTRTRRGTRGYTVVEILAAMTLFAIGAAGVISMEQVTIKGGTDARRFDVAANIANEWAFRLQRDSMFWTEPNAASPTTSNLTTRTRWLKDTPTTGWKMPTIPAAGSESGMSPAFGVYGQDLPPAGGVNEHMYCVQYRLEWMADPGVAPNLKPGALIHADIRVFWARLDRAPITDCSSLNPPPDDSTAPQNYHFVYLTTALRQNPNR